MVETSKRLEGLLHRLRELKVEGVGRGGPFLGVVHNEVTRELLAEGMGIVPLLLERIGSSELDETIFLVFLLRELRSINAKGAIEKLLDSPRFRGKPRDLTLEMQVQFYLRDVDSW